MKWALIILPLVSWIEAPMHAPAGGLWFDTHDQCYAEAQRIEQTGRSTEYDKRKEKHVWKGPQRYAAHCIRQPSEARP